VEVHRKGVHHLSRRQRQQATETQQSKNTQPNRRGKNTNNILEISNFRKPVKKRVELLPKNVAQEQYIECLEDPSIDIVIATGPAGCGKTFLATLEGIRRLKEGSIDKFVVGRSITGLDGEDIGFLPGNIMQKMSPWTRPILDIFEEYYSVKEIVGMIEENILELLPLAHVRGRTFKNSFIIIDESQNMSRKSMLATLTRLGDNSKMVVTGDVNQSDLGKDNGLSDFLHRFSNSNRIQVCEFGRQDIERHPVIGEILKMYGEE